MITLDGVLRDPRTQAIRPQGLTLYRALTGVGRVAVLCGSDVQLASYFLATNGLVQHGSLIPEALDSAPTTWERRLSQIGELRKQGSHIEMVIEPDPQVAAYLLDNGIPVMVYLHPQFTTPSFRPDYESVAKPWDDLVERVDYQVAMRAEAALKEKERVDD